MYIIHFVIKGSSPNFASKIKRLLNGLAHCKFSALFQFQLIRYINTKYLQAPHGNQFLYLLSRNSSSPVINELQKKASKIVFTNIHDGLKTKC